MDIDTIINQTPDALIRQLSQRVKERRLEMNLTQKAFAWRSGVGYDAYRKFESTGEITLRNLLLCAIAMNCTDGFSELFSRKSYQSIDELLKVSTATKRKRGTKNE